MIALLMLLGLVATPMPPVITVDYHNYLYMLCIVNSEGAGHCIPTRLPPITRTPSSWRY